MKKLYLAFIASLLFFVIAAINYTDTLETKETVHSDFKSSIRFIQPNPESGVGTYNSPSTKGYYETIGWSLMFGGEKTLLRDDVVDYAPDGWMEETYTPSPKYSSTFHVKTYAGNKRVMEGSKYMVWDSGVYQYMNVKVLVNPANFDQNSLVMERSLVDNLLLETSGTDRDNMEDSLAKGGTAYINAIFSGVPSGGTHGVVYGGKLWKNGKYAFSKPANTFVNNDIYSRLTYSEFSKGVIDTLLDIKVLFPQIIEVDRTNPTVSFSPYSSAWGNVDVPVQITPKDNGSGVSSWRMRTYYNDPQYGTTGTWSAWSSYFPPAARQLTMQGIEGKIQVEVVDKAGNRATVTSGMYQIEKSMPALESETLTGADYYDGTTYWVKPNKSVTFTVRQRDSQSRNLYQFARVMDGNTIAARSRHDFLGSYTTNVKLTTSTQVSIDAAYRTLNTFQGEVKWTITPKVNGKMYELQRYFRDVAGNSRTYEPGIKLGIDGQGPTVTASPSSGGWNRNGYSVSLNYSDADSGLVTSQYAWSKSTATPTSWTNYSSTVSQTQEGTWYLHYKSTDAVGNVSMSYFGPYQVDTTKASLVSESFTGADYFDGTTYWVRENKSVTYTVSQTDNLSGNRSQLARILENGTIVAKAIHDFRNSDIYNISHTDTDSNVSIDGVRRTSNTSQGTVVWTITPKTHGKSYAVQRYLYDIAWNADSYTTGALLAVDGVAPVVQADKTSGTWNATGHSVTLNYTDADSGIATKQYAWTKSTATPTSWTNYTGTVSQTQEGIWYLHYKTTDRVGNVNTGYFGVYQIDTTLPTSVSESLTGADYFDGSKYWVRENTSVKYTVAQNDTLSGNYSQFLRMQENGSIVIRVRHDFFDADIYNMTHGVTDANVVVDGARRTSNTSTGTVEWTITPKTHGKVYEVQRYLRDRANNANGYVTSALLAVDSVAPVVQANKTSGTWNATGHSVTLNYTDANSGIATKQYAWTKSTATPTSWTNYTGTVSQTQEGIWYLHYKTTDKVGNLKTGYFGVYQIDTTLPTSVSESLTGADYFDGSIYWVRENKSVKYTVSQYDILSGNHKQFLRMLENGLTVIRVGHDFTNSDIYNANHEVTNANVVVNGARRTSNTSTGTVEWTITPKTHGKVYEVQRYISDKAGNSNGYKTSALLAMDAVAPTIQADKTSGAWSATGHTVSLTYADANTNVVTKKYAWSQSTATPTSWNNYTGPVTQSQEGIWYLHYTATDSVGNTKTGYFGPYKIDKTNPNGVLAPYSAGWTNKNIFTTFNPSDSESGVSQWRYRISTDNGLSYGSWSSYIVGDTNKSIVLTTEARNKVQVEITDNVGHIQLLTSGSYDIDKTKPSGVFSRYSSTWTNQSISTIFNPSDAGGSGVYQWRYRISLDDGITYSSWSAFINGDTSQSITLANESKSKIQAEVFDNAGNVQILTSGTFKIDKTNPTGSFTPNSTKWTPAFTTEFIPSDNGGSEVSYWIYRLSTNNGSTYGSWSSAILGENPKEIALNSNGQNKLQAIVYDNAGNRVTITSGTFYIDNIKPTAPSIIVSQSSPEKASFTIIHGTDTAYSGFARTEYKLSGANTSEWVTYKGEITIEEEGVTTIEARTIDVAGNESAVDKEQIILSSTEEINEISIFPSGSEEWLNRGLDVTVSYSGTSDTNGITAKTYELTSSSELPSTLTQTLPADGVVGISQNGTTYIHVRYEFEDGSTLVRTEGPYKIDEAAIGAFTMTLKDGAGNEVTNWTNQNLILEMVLTPQGESTTELQYKVEGESNWNTYESGTVINKEGETRIVGRAVNEAGTVSEQQYVTAKIDKTNPSFKKINLHETTSRNNVKTYSVSVAANTDISGISRIELSDGTALMRDVDNDTYNANHLTTQPTTVKVYDVAGNMTEESFFEFANIAFANGYATNQGSTSEDVIATISGSGKVSYQLGNQVFDCGTSPCEVTIDKNTELSSINVSGIKQSKKTLFIDNIDKSPTRLIFSGERQSQSDIAFNWNIEIADSSITCEYVRGIENITPGSGTSFLFTGAENYKYDCVLTGTLDGDYISSNEVTIEPDYTIEAPSESNSAIAKVAIPSNIIVEQSRIGTFYYINFRSQNYEEPIPLPGELF